eukprot:2091494-Rhodomonas_salina.3
MGYHTLSRQHTLRTDSHQRTLSTGSIVFCQRWQHSVGMSERTGGTWGAQTERKRVRGGKEGRNTPPL